MFAYSPVETENIFYNPKYSFNNNGVPTNQPPPSTTCGGNHHHMLSLIPDSQEREQQRKNLEQFHEATIKRIQLKQELQRRHQLCAENERLRRERTERQNAQKKVEKCNALRKFYEQKAAQRCNMNSSKYSSKSRTSSIKQFQAAFKIYSFIKHNIEKRKTQKILATLIKLRSVQNRLSVLKSINLKLGTLTFDLINKSKVLPTSANNKAFLIYKDSILKVLDQLDNEFTDEFYLIRERKKIIKDIANNMLQELDRERDSQYETFVGQKEFVDDDFVIINRN
ncbi:3494_t:CDS:2 [Funneliformis caledonium]|uniref:3494_t:CDS:1 n=2 Tax=Funneliformis TaxID=1117308 RepID=A0A9N9AB92_9GLOM|nr:3494_t:CDS:2 [Funneliformis caledonium]CAG8570992.1 78_t:CDS:2 [Funneliformis mosseae]